MKNRATATFALFVQPEGDSRRLLVSGWISRYKWHVVFWVGYFFYAFLTDKLTYGKYIYFSKSLIMVATHPVYLFYAFLYCLRKFDKRTPLKLAKSILLFCLATGLFWVMRIAANYYLYPVWDVARGLEKERIITYDFILNGVFWITEFLIKSAFFYYVTKYLKKERQFNVVLSEKLDQEKALTEKRIEHEVALQQQREYKRRETMFINLVHETRTPITLIKNYIDDHIDKHGSTPDLEVVRRNVSKLTRDVTNLFDLERFRHGVEIFDHNQSVDFSALLEETYDLFLPYCQKKHIQLSKAVQEQVIISADPSALNRIVNNLLENAIKYSSPETEILISLSSARGIVSFAVSDQGRGIEKEELKSLFVPYQQLNRTKKNFQGMGLGLPIVNNIVSGLSGEISVNQNVPRGTTVTVLLPVGQKTPLVEMEALKPNEPVIEELKPIGDVHTTEDAPVVLVVEDNHDVNEYLVRKLSQKFNVRSAANGAEALRKIKDELPDLIISDVMMDNMDGFEFAKVIRETPSFSHIPIIFLTAKTAGADKMRGLSLGALDYVEKPFAMNELLKKVESLLLYTDKQQRKVYDDMYRTMRKLSRKGALSIPDELAPETEDGAFLLRCRDFDLTKRETEITKFLVMGKTNKWIAENIYISPRTVETHISNIYEKLNVTNKVELVKLFK